LFCDNQFVIAKSSQPESLLKKKSNAIAYNAVSEACAMKEIIICDIKTDDNIAEIMTKVLPSGETRDTLVEQLIYDIASGVVEYNTPQTGMRVSKDSLGLKTLHQPPVGTNQHNNNTNYKRKLGM
jgi:hypothetical protein